ncbi:unnamed protein product [Pleuronectes platessa]|uniref:Uncharacterized protein n=1 Tax=Pleuronectes platessa TaxID=8262 RepID=A0A9N7YXJ5_PLEPL|nr:unnamed protein product [Pleuronectes platessa]
MVSCVGPSHRETPYHGQRPSLEELSNQVELRGLVGSWKNAGRPVSTQRPSSLECTNITEKLYERQEPGINDAVYEVLYKLREQRRRDKQKEELQSLCVSLDRTSLNEQNEQDKLTEKGQWLRVTPASGSPTLRNHDTVKTGPPPVQIGQYCGVSSLRVFFLLQGMAPGRISNQRVKDPPASRQASMCDGDTTRLSTDDHELKASSVRPIGESLAPPSTTRSRQASAAKNPPQLFQEPSERKRLPTAPSRVNPPSPHPGSSKNRNASHLCLVRWP